MSDTPSDPGAPAPYAEAVKAYGRYFLVKKIAEGGMAEIFLAKQVGAEGFERNVVIKRMLAHLSGVSDFVDMFLDEARLAARLAHPNIVQINDLGLTDGCYYICMEYLPGEDLSTIVRAASRRPEYVPLNVVARVIMDAAHGLHFAHEFSDENGKRLNVVHRDISPSNVFVTYQGTTKLLDFGIAKAESRITTTIAGVVKGKYTYMAPEQASGAVVDRRADVFSLGVTLYEALTNTRPFAKDTDLAILSALLKGDYPAPRMVRPDLPQELEAIVLKAMAFKAESRYQSAGELAAALQEFLDANSSGSGGTQITTYLKALFGEQRLIEKSRIPTLTTLAQSGVGVPGLVSARPRQADISAPGEKEPATEARSVTPLRPRGRGTRSRFLIAGALVLLLTAGGLVRHFWGAEPIPAGCIDLSNAGLPTTYGDLNAGSIHFAATMNLTSSNGVININKVRNVNALMMAVDEMNTLGGAGRRTFVLHICDTANDPTRLKAQLDWLIHTQGVSAVIVPSSTQMINAASVTVPAGVLILSPTATSPDITSLPKTLEGSVPLIWRTAPSDELQGRVLADLLLGAGPAGVGSSSRVGLIYSGESYGQGLESVIFDRLNTLNDGGQSVSSFEYPPGGDITQAVSQLASFRPDLTVLIGLPADAVKILNAAARTPALTVDGGNRWFFTDAVKDPSVLAGVSDFRQLRNALGTAPAQKAGSAYPAFASHYFNRFNADPGSFAFTSHSYDAMYLLGLAASYSVAADNSQPLTGRRMAEGLTKVSNQTATVYPLGPSSYIPARSGLQRGTINVEGASGKLNFNPTTGDVLAPIELWTITDAGFDTIATIEPPGS